MDSSFESLFGFYEFTSGRRLFALRQVRALAHEQDFTELVKHCDAAVTHELATRELERRWAGEPADTGTNPAAQRIDVLVGGNDEHRAMVQQLESLYDEAEQQTIDLDRAINDLPSGDELAAEFEQFLRDQSE